MKASKRLRSRQRGSAFIEFVLSISLFWLPLFLGTLVIGFNLVRAVQVTEVCRDAGHMYSQGTDFSTTTYQNLLIDMATGLNLSNSGANGVYGGTSGNGVVVLSTVIYVNAAACTAGGYSGNTCPNINQPVIARQIVIGNNTVHASTFGTPTVSEMDSSGNVAQGSPHTSGYLNDSADRAANFLSVIPLTSGQLAYVSEMWVTSPDLSWWSFLGTTGEAARSIF